MLIFLLFCATQQPRTPQQEAISQMESVEAAVLQEQERAYAAAHSFEKSFSDENLGKAANSQELLRDFERGVGRLFELQGVFGAHVNFSDVVARVAEKFFLFLNGKNPDLLERFKSNYYAEVVPGSVFRNILNHKVKKYESLEKS